jgi:hypothetical protein
MADVDAFLRLPCGNASREAYVESVLEALEQRQPQQQRDDSARSHSGSRNGSRQQRRRPSLLQAATAVRTAGMTAAAADAMMCGALPVQVVLASQRRAAMAAVQRCAVVHQTVRPSRVTHRRWRRVVTLVVCKHT